MTKTQRQHRIAKLVASSSITSQAQLVGLLRDEGIEATQATVSRDLEELGATKARGADGRRVLVLPDEAHTAPPLADQLHRVLAEWVVDVVSSGALVVVRTPPGCAHVVASALDRSPMVGTLGTVAGDDTIFVAVDERVGGAAVAAAVRTIAGLARAPRQQPRSTRPAGRPARRGG